MMKQHHRPLVIGLIILLVILLAPFPGSTVLPGFAQAVTIPSPSALLYFPRVNIAPSPTPTPTPTITPTPTLRSIGQPPLPSTSYYMRSLDIEIARQLGCLLGTRDFNTPGKQESVVVLAYSYPQQKNGVFGATTYHPTLDFASVDDIAASAENFGYGYWMCSDPDSHLYIGIATNNHQGSLYPSVTYEHGRAWSQMVVNADNWLNSGSGCPRGCDGQVNAIGAVDIELTWNSASTSANWVKGYSSVSNFRELINFGALEGCPYLASPGAQCGNYASYTWSKDQVLEVTAYPWIRPLPEIYLTNGVNAEQWYLMSLYAAKSSKFARPFNFLGPLTEYQACLQVGGCTFSGVGINNTPNQGWKQLATLVLGDSRTLVGMNFASDMKWQGGKDVTFPPTSGSINPQVQKTLAPVTSRNKPATLAIPTLAVEPPQYVTPQIIEGSEALVHPWEADIRNLWKGMYNGDVVILLAGAAPDNASQGLVVIQTNNLTTGEFTQQYYFAPANAGALRVTDVTGSRATLQTARVEHLYFDLSTKTFQP